MSLADFQPLLETVKLKAFQLLPDRCAERTVLMCGGPRSQEPSCLVVVERDEFVLRHPETGGIRIMVPVSGRLLAGRYLLLCDYKNFGPRLDALDLETLEFTEGFIRVQSEGGLRSQVESFDVDPTRRYAMIHSLYDPDCPEIDVYDQERGECLALDCEDLINVPMEVL